MNLQEQINNSLPGETVRLIPGEYFVDSPVMFLRKRRYLCHGVLLRHLHDQVAWALIPDESQDEYPTSVDGLTAIPREGIGLGIHIITK